MSVQLTEAEPTLPEIPQIQMMAPTEVTPYESNPRLNEEAVQGVIDSITEFGFNVPITVDGDLVIVTGHTRLKAAEQMGLKKVPVIVLKHLTEEQARAYRLADNRLQENSAWDEKLLAEELEILRQLGVDLKMTGFNQDELDCLLEPVTADCLDDLNLDSVCGDVEDSKVKAATTVIISIGSFRFRCKMDKFLDWEKKMHKEHEEREDLIFHLAECLGLTEALILNEKAEV